MRGELLVFDGGHWEKSTGAAKLTDGFSFAYLKELFVSAMME